MRLVAHSTWLTVPMMVMVLVGCGSARTKSSDPMSQAFDLITHTGSFNESQQAITVAEDELSATCMKELGLAYPAETPLADGHTQDPLEIGLERRRQSGYGLSDSWAKGTPEGGGEAQEFASQLDRYVAALPDVERTAYRRALFGDGQHDKTLQLPYGGGAPSFPTTGCVAEARTKLFGDVVQWARVVYVPQAFNDELIRRLEGDPAYAAVMNEWQRCMVREGHQFRGPDEVLESVRERLRANGNVPEVRSYEIMVAVADGTCALEIRIPDQVLDLKRKHLLELSNDDRLALTAVADIWSRAVDIAKRVNA